MATVIKRSVNSRFSIFTPIIIWVAAHYILVVFGNMINLLKLVTPYST